jgi:hypothetical protein
MTTDIKYTAGAPGTRDDNVTVRTRCKGENFFLEGDSDSRVIGLITFSTRATSNKLEIRPADPDTRLFVQDTDPVATGVETFYEVEMRGDVPVTITCKRLTFPAGGEFNDPFIVATQDHSLLAALEAAERKAAAGGKKELVIDGRPLITTRARVKAPSIDP